MNDKLQNISKAQLKQTLEKARKHAILPDPNPYGKWVSIKNHNRVVEEALSYIQTYLGGSY